MKTYKFLIHTLLLCFLASVATSCDSVIYDEEGDCAPYHKVRFIYDHNLKFADAFASEVGSVTLYAVDPATGEVVWSRHEEGDALRQPGYMMDVDIDPGRYTLIAWCGEGHTSHFTVNEHNAPGRDALRCRLTARDDNAPADDPHHVSHSLGHLYHGTLEAEEFTSSQGVHIHEVKLKKDTNDVHIVLQHLDGSPVDPDDFLYNIHSANGHMEWDNRLAPDNTIAYHPWWTGSAIAGMEQPDGTITTPGTVSDSRVQTTASAAIADLRTSRLVMDNSTEVSVTLKDGTPVLSIPLIDYAVMVKGQHRHLDDQEYLDRQDDYSLVFFLDKNNKWVSSHIYVNSWKIVLQNTDIK